MGDGSIPHELTGAKLKRPVSAEPKGHPDRERRLEAVSITGSSETTMLSVRVVLGVASIPLGLPVEIELLVEAAD